MSLFFSFVSFPPFFPPICDTGTVWAVIDQGDLVFREGVSAQRPLGLLWRTVNGLTVDHFNLGGMPANQDATNEVSSALLLFF